MRRNCRHCFAYVLPILFTTGDPAIGGPQKIRVVEESPTLLLPADVAASGFYITNMHNIIIGNVASGGWAGFAFPNLAKPVGFHRTMNYVPKEKVSLEIDGNTGKAILYLFPPSIVQSSSPPIYRFLIDEI